MDVETFYTTVSSISFTLLGLWWVVVQGRETWRMNPARRRMAYVVSLHFVLPGVMSILALVAPEPDRGERWVWSMLAALLANAVTLLFGLVAWLVIGRSLRPVTSSAKASVSAACG